MENETIVNELNDLSVTEADEAELKGGPKKIFIGGLSGIERQVDLLDLELQAEIKGGPNSGTFFNHNETTIEDEGEEIADLPVDEQAEAEIKGGSGQNGILFNHNETTIEDEGEEIADLFVVEQDEAEIKGGPLKRIRVGGMSFGDENGTNS